MITFPATVMELAEAAGPVTPAVWSAMRGQMAGGTSCAVRGPDAELLAVGGLYLESGKAEAWFFATLAARRHMGLVLRAARLTLQQSPHDQVTVTTRTRAGARIARLAGFRWVGMDGAKETWVHERTS